MSRLTVFPFHRAFLSAFVVLLAFGGLAAFVALAASAPALAAPDSAQPAALLNQPLAGIAPTLSFTFTDSGQNLGNTTSSAVALGDLDGDHDLDAFVAVSGNNYSSPNMEDRIWSNDGKGNFQDSGQRLGGNALGTDVELGDLNGDGALDAVVTNMNSTNAIYINDGKGRLEPNGDRPGSETFQTFDAVLGDIDSDGDYDLALAEISVTTIWFNDGTGAFSFGAELNSWAYKVVFGDLDSDTDLDLVIYTGSSVVIYLNQDGLGTYFFNGEPLLADCRGLNTCRDMHLGDLDNDGALDIIVLGGLDDSMYSGNGHVFFNDGLGNFQDSGQFVVPDGAWQAFDLGDLNGDGAVDIFAGANLGTISSFFLNDGDGVFTATVGYGTPSLNEFRVSDVALGDLDGDGDLDVFAANGDERPDKILFNNGGPILSDTGQSLALEGANAAAFGDVDGDGDLDVFVGGSHCLPVGIINPTPSREFCAPSDAVAQPSRVFLNDGAGIFVDSGQALSATITSDVALADIDEDGDLDAFVAGRYGPGVFFINDGSGVFEIGQMISDATSAVFGDLDEDGDLDLALGRGDMWRPDDYADEIWFNDGWGNFVQGDQLLGSDPTVEVSLGDLDGDGDLDLVSLSDRYPGSVWLNDGNGEFTDSYQSLYTGYSSGAALGDLDGDGDLDLFVVNSNLYPGRVFFNDGDAHLVDSGQAIGFGDTLGVDLGDLDGDGDLDALYSDFDALRTAINDGKGHFQPISTLPPGGSGYYQGAVLGDVDSDGDADAFVMTCTPWFNLSSDQQIWLNNFATNHGFDFYVVKPGFTADANYFSSPELLEDVTIPLDFGIVDAQLGFHSQSSQIGQVQGFYSLAGGGQWLKAVATTNTVTGSLAAGSHTYEWDVPASSFFGASDNVVFRLEAYPQFKPEANGVPGPYQWPFISSTTYPFGVRGTQVRVMKDGVPALDAFAFRLPAGQTSSAQVLGSSGDIFYTDYQGYLRGRGAATTGDGLMALWPVTQTLESFSAFSKQTPQDILDADWISSTLSVTVTGEILDVNVIGLKGTHSWISDLYMVLISPQGSWITLMDSPCGNEENFDLSYDDDAASDQLACPPIGGDAYQPLEPLSTFDGENSKGVWTLIVTDQFAFDTGVLEKWGLEITTESGTYDVYYTSAAPTEGGLQFTPGDRRRGADADCLFRSDFDGV